MAAASANHRPGLLVTLRRVCLRCCWQVTASGHRENAVAFPGGGCVARRATNSLSASVLMRRDRPICRDGS
jgi:hypothetical protein